MKKWSKILILACIAAFVIVVIVLVVVVFRPRSFFDIVGMKREEITGIELYDDCGWMRTPCFETEEQKDIDRVLNVIDVKYRFSRKVHPQTEGSPQYTMVLMAGEKKAIVHFELDVIWYGSTIYHAVSENIDEAILEVIGSVSSKDETF